MLRDNNKLSASLHAGRLLLRQLDIFKPLRESWGLKMFGGTVKVWWEMVGAGQL